MLTYQQLDTQEYFSMKFYSKFKHCHSRMPFGNMCIDVAKQNDKEVLTSYESQNASGKYPTMHHFVTEMCTFLLENGAWWDMELTYFGICAAELLYEYFVRIHVLLCCFDANMVYINAYNNCIINQNYFRSASTNFSCIASDRLS